MLSEFRREVVWISSAIFHKTFDRIFHQMVLFSGIMHILYVEDDLTIQAQTAKYLRSQSHLVTTFTNAPDALKFARTEPFDVLLCDFRLENSPDGLTLAAQIRNLFPARPIVMISSFATLDDMSRGYDVDVDAYLKRPIALLDLMNKIYGAVERRRAKFPQSALVTSSDVLELDHSQKLAIWHGEPLALTPAEFALLALLVSKPGQVFSISDLCALTKATRIAADDARNLLKQHFSNLRQKLTQEGKYPDPIQNVRGQGYKWVVNEEETTSSD
jgi:DNA-binding response OmpR family regulator